MTVPNKPWNRPIDITQEGSDQKIREAGEEARAMDLLLYTLVCNEHGEFKWNVPEGKVDIEITRHRLGEACYHGIEAR